MKPSIPPTLPAKAGRRIKIEDLNLALFLLAVFATVAVVRVFRFGTIPARFNPDCYTATAFARLYLHRPFSLEIHDLYTQGFVHPFLYVPLVGFFEAIGTPPRLQDDFAITVVYGLSVGLITLLSYLCARAWLSRDASTFVAMLPVAGLLLHYEMDTISPNGEILGSVLLLAFWAVLLHRCQLRHWLTMAVVLGTITFHLKYQLVPQLILFGLFAGLPRHQLLRLLAILAIACLVTDLVVYRLNGEGLISRAGSLLSDYAFKPTSAPVSGDLLPGTVNHAPLGIDLWRWVGRVWRYAPGFLIAWGCWLPVVFAAGKQRKPVAKDLLASLVLSLATLGAIALPGKDFEHYYHLLIPTSLFVLVMALRHTRWGQEPIEVST